MRAQASVEYLVTYGWAFIVIIVMVGALAYFGVINPSRWVPDKCDFGSQLECADYELQSAAFSGGAARVNLYLRNSFGKDIQVTSAKIRKADGTFDGTSPTITIPTGKTASVAITLTDGTLLQQKEKQQLIVVVGIQRAAAGAAAHNITGVIYAVVK